VGHFEDHAHVVVVLDRHPFAEVVCVDSHKPSETCKIASECPAFWNNRRRRRYSKEEVKASPQLRDTGAKSAEEAGRSPSTGLPFTRLDDHSENPLGV
jgi:hypothetical protein